MCIYMHVRMYVCMYVCVHTNVCVYCMCMCGHVGVCVDMCVCVWVCVGVGGCVCVHAWKMNWIWCTMVNKSCKMISFHWTCNSLILMYVGMLALFISTIDWLIGHFSNLPSQEFVWNTRASIDQQSPKQKVVQWDISQLHPSTLVQYLSYHLCPWLRLGLGGRMYLADHRSTDHRLRITWFLLETRFR